MYRMTWVDYQGNSHEKFEEDDPSAHREAKRLVEEDEANFVELHPLPPLPDSIVERLQKRVLEMRGGK